MDVPTMFPPIDEPNITFCVDTSGSMYQALSAVKQHLVETLQKMTAFPRETMFNIIEFNSHVTQWADRMVRCTPETVEVASEWIHSLTASSGTNTLDALLTAFEDDQCDAIYLITDSIPDQHHDTVLDNVSLASQSRPVHCVYLSIGEQIDPKVDTFLQNLSFDTYGSYHVVGITKHGVFEKVTPIVSSDSLKQRVIQTDVGLPLPNQKVCSITSSLQIDPEIALMRSMYPPQHPWMYHPWYGYSGYQPSYGWARYRSAHSWMAAQNEMYEGLGNVSLAAGALLVDMVVLVRRHADGWWYRGVVRSQIATNKFLVAIGPCKHGKYQDTTYQETYDYDVISYDDAKYHSIVTSDKVLAPWQPGSEKFGPAVVIDGQELRHSQQESSNEKQGLTVKFQDGVTQDIPLDVTVWITPQLYDRLTIEQRMPPSAKNDLTSDIYPSKSLAGYPTSGPRAIPADYIVSPELCYNHEPGSIVYPQYPPYFGKQFPYPNPYFGYNPISIPSPVNPIGYPSPVVFKQHKKEKSLCVVDSDEMNALIPGTEITNAELNDKVSSQLTEHQEKVDNGTKRCDNQNNGVYRTERDCKPSKYYECTTNQNEIDFKHNEDNMDEIDQIKYENCYKNGYKNGYCDNDRRILQKRDTVKDNNLKKSVTWKSDELSKLQPENSFEYTDCDHDSGLGSSPDVCPSNQYSRYHDDMCVADDAKIPVKFCEKVSPDDIKLPRDLQKLCCYCKKCCADGRVCSPPEKPTWKYWRSDSRPETVGPPSHDRFVETVPATPLELRHKDRGNPLYTHVSREHLSVNHHIVPPEPLKSHPPTVKQGPGTEIGHSVGSKQQLIDTRNDRREEIRRLRYSEREETIANQHRDERNRQKMADVNRFVRQDEREIKENLRRDEEHAKLLHTQQAKQFHDQYTAEAMDRGRVRIDARWMKREEVKDERERTAAEIQTFHDQYTAEAMDRGRVRIDAQRMKREVREAGEVVRDENRVNGLQREQEGKLQRHIDRCTAHNQQLAEMDNREKMLDRRCQSAKLERLRGFQQREEQLSYKRELKTKMDKQHLDTYKSQVFA